MSISAARFIPHEMKTSIIKIVSYRDKKLSGVLINPYFSRDMYFDNAIQFLLLMEELQDSLNYPQESMENRTFVPGKSAAFIPSEQYTQAELKDLRPAATFKINILFRQNASWQGSIAWLDKSTEAQFRSFLELLILLDSVLCDLPS
jgi:hypothetical protein